MSGHLAEDGDYGDGISAKLVVIVDGAPWIENHVLPQVPWAVSILYAYHALEHVSDYAAIRDDLPETEKHDKARDSLVNYFEENRYRMDYILSRTRGYQIGSGAMESLHRTASQARLKIPGGRWLEETSQAIFNLRMMAMVGKWEEFWHQPDLTDRLIEAFNERKKATKKDALEAA